MVLVSAILEMANLVLSAASIIIAVPLINKSKRVIHADPWKYLLVSIALFAILQIFSNLRTFGAMEVPYLTHIITSLILIFFLVALIKTERLARG